MLGLLLYDEKWLSADFVKKNSNPTCRLMTAIVAMVSDNGIYIKGDTLSLEIRDDGSGEILDRHYHTKIFKLTDKLVVGFSCLALDSALSSAIQSYSESYNDSKKTLSVVKSLCKYLNKLTKGKNGTVQLLVAGYDGNDPIFYKVEYDGKAIYSSFNNSYPSIGVPTEMISDILNGTQVSSIDDILFRISDIEKKHIEAYKYTMLHIGGHITGWHITPKGAIELPESTEELPTQVNKGDFVRSIVGRTPYKNT